MAFDGPPSFNGSPGFNVGDIKEMYFEITVSANPPPNIHEGCSESCRNSGVVHPNYFVGTKGTPVTVLVGRKPRKPKKKKGKAVKEEPSTVESKEEENAAAEAENPEAEPEVKLTVATEAG